MPTYSYDCHKCNEWVEIIRKMTDEEEVPVCFNCNELMTRRFTAAPVQFKGTGFYKTGG